jgi:hypothetical protein
MELWVDLEHGVRAVEVEGGVLQLHGVGPVPSLGRSEGRPRVHVMRVEVKVLVCYLKVIRDHLADGKVEAGEVAGVPRITLAENENLLEFPILQVLVIPEVHYSIDLEVPIPVALVFLPGPSLLELELEVALLRVEVALLPTTPCYFTQIHLYLSKLPGNSIGIGDVQLRLELSHELSLAYPLAVVVVVVSSDIGDLE